MLCSLVSPPTGPDIIHSLDDNNVWYGSSFELRAQYAYSKYPVTIKWYAGSQMLGSQQNSARGGWTTLKIRNVKATRSYKAVVTDPYNHNKSDSTECTVYVIWRKGHV